MGDHEYTFSEKFHKSERLKSRSLIQDLFTNGSQKRFFPLVLYYKTFISEDPSYHKILFSVPKKHFKKAVVRNKIRRKIREAYRRNKALLYNNYTGVPFLLGYVYISKNIPDYKEVEAAIVASLNYLTELKNRK